MLLLKEQYDRREKHIEGLEELRRELSREIAIYRKLNTDMLEEIEGNVQNGRYDDDREEYNWAVEEMRRKRLTKSVTPIR